MFDFLFAVLSLLLVLIPIIAFHELGHFLVARACKVHVETFSVGFGRQLWARTDRHGTVWRLALFPLGGYVKMADQLDPDQPPALNGKRPFRACAPWQRALILLAGPGANFILAAMIFSVIGLFQGIPDPDFQPQAVIQEVQADMPAERAGLRGQDTIIAANGQTIQSPADLIAIIAQQQDQTLELEVRRDGQILTFLVQPEQVEQRWMIGVRFGASSAPMVQQNVFRTFAYGAEYTWRIAAFILSELWKLIAGQSSIDNLGGIITVAAVSQQAAVMGVVIAFQFLALMSINVGILNLLPIPILDGGQLCLLALEKIRKKPLSPQQQETVTKIGLFLILFIFVLATINDLLRYLF